MATVDWDTLTITKNFLDSALPADVAVRLQSDTDTGGAKARPHSPDDKITISEPDVRTMDRADIFYETFDKHSTVFISIKSKNKVNDLWQQVMAAILDNRKNPGGNWDRIEWEDLSVDDDTFQKFTSTIQLTYVADSQTYSGAVGQ